MSHQLKPIVFAMDDSASTADRRLVLADIVEQAVHDGAKAIVLDIYFKSETPSDARLRQTLLAAKNAGISVFAVAPFDNLDSYNIFNNCGSTPFEETVIMGHNLARTNDEPGEIPNPTRMNNYEESHCGRGYYSVPLLVAGKLRGWPTQLGMEQGKPSDLELGLMDNHYRDLTGADKPPLHSYKDHTNIDLKGAVVFIGGTVASISGAPVDVVMDDTGKQSYGVYDVVSATMAYYSRIADPAEFVISPAKK